MGSTPVDSNKPSPVASSGPQNKSKFLMKTQNQEKENDVVTKPPISGTSKVPMGKVPHSSQNVQ